MSFGQTLRAAREAKGLTTSELAAQTHLLVQIVEGLENEDFRRIPAPIYGRGFVKLYCETVGLEPKPLQAEFMTLYNQKKDAPEKVPPPAPPKQAPVVPPPPKPEPVIAPPPPEPEPLSLGVVMLFNLSNPLKPCFNFLALVAALSSASPKSSIPPIASSS